MWRDTERQRDNGRQLQNGCQAQSPSQSSGYSKGAMGVPCLPTTFLDTGPHTGSRALPEPWTLTAVLLLGQDLGRDIQTSPDGPLCHNRVTDPRVSPWAGRSQAQLGVGIPAASTKQLPASLIWLLGQSHHQNLPTR